MTDLFTTPTLIRRSDMDTPDSIYAPFATALSWAPGRDDMTVVGSLDHLARLFLGKELIISTYHEQDGDWTGTMGIARVDLTRNPHLIIVDGVDL